MPFHTNWKDGKPKIYNYVKDTPDPFKKVNMIDDGLWCKVCRLPRAPEHYVLAQSILEEENQEIENQHTINALSSKIFVGER